MNTIVFKRKKEKRKKQSEKEFLDAIIKGLGVFI